MTVSKPSHDGTDDRSDDGGASRDGGPSDGGPNGRGPDSRTARGPPAIALEGVTKRYGPATALDDVDLAIRPGTFHGLLGPNGSGKTTLFGLVAGLARPTSGRVRRPGEAGTGGADPDAGAAGSGDEVESGAGPVSVGFSFQEPRFYPDLTVRENLGVFRRFVDDPPPASWHETLLSELRLEPAAHRRAGDLSGGFRKKLDLALALAKRPTCLLLDEPLADVDEYSRRGIRSFLDAYCEAGRTVVVSTHNVADFADAFDRVTVLVDGTIRADGPAADDVLAQYRDALE